MKKKLVGTYCVGISLLLHESGELDETKLWGCYGSSFPRGSRWSRDANFRTTTIPCGMRFPTTGVHARWKRLDTKHTQKTNTIHLKSFAHQMTVREDRKKT